MINTVRLLVESDWYSYLFFYFIIIIIIIIIFQISFKVNRYEKRSA